MSTAQTDAPVLSLSLRNIARYVRDIDANLPLYEALGFKLSRNAGDMNVLEHADGMQLVLHRWDDRPTTMLDTAIGFSLAGDAEPAKEYLEAAGWNLLRAPHESDVGYFWIYGDLDGNPVNLVGKPTGQAPPPGTVKLVLKDGVAVAEY
jgi:hypothetical protein